MSDRIERAAAAWALRHPIDMAGRCELDAWLAQDRQHAGALLRAQAGLSVIDRSLTPKAVETVISPSIVPSYRAAPNRRRLLAGIGSAVAATIAGVLGWPIVMGEHVATELGEIRRLPLADGSVATIDTGSELRVLLASDSRRIALNQGQAWFQVAKDRTRPFIVDAGIAEVRAVGTAFSVRRTARGVQVAVTEGAVAAWPKGANGAMTILEEGQFATFVPGSDAPTTGSAPAAIERSLAWRSGEIALENETLDTAVVQFNRYNRQQLVIDDAGLGHERLVGLFRVDKPAAFAEALAASIDVAVTTTPAEIRLRRKKIDRP